MVILCSLINAKNRNKQATIGSFKLNTYSVVKTLSTTQRNKFVLKLDKTISQFVKLDIRDGEKNKL